MNLLRRFLRGPSGPEREDPVPLEPGFFIAAGERLRVAPADGGRRLDLVSRSPGQRRVGALRLPPGLLVLDAVVASRPDRSEVVVTAEFDAVDRRGEVAWWPDPLPKDGAEPRRSRLWVGPSRSVFRSLLVWDGSLLVLDVRHRVVHRLVDADGDGVWERPARPFAGPAMFDGVRPAELRYVERGDGCDSRRVLVVEHLGEGEGGGSLRSRAHVLVDADGDGVAERRYGA